MALRPYRFERLSKEEYISAVTISGIEIFYVPDDLIDRDIVSAALATYPKAINCLPQHKIDKELAKEVLINRGSLSNIPLSVIDAELCDIAVKANWRNYQYVPHHLMTKDLFLDLIVTRSLPVPHHLQTKDIYIEAIKRNHRMTQYIPQSVIDYELATILVNETECGIIFVPTHLIDLDLIKMALEDTPLNLIPIKTREVCLEALKAAPTNFIHIPQEIIDYDFLVQAAKIEHVFTFFPNSLITRELALIAIQSNPSSFQVFQHIPDTLKDVDLCLSALMSKYPLKWMPYTDEAFRIEAVKIDPKNLSMIERPTRTLCLEAVRINGIALQYVPLEMRDEEICQLAIQSNPLAIKNVPSPTDQMFMQALQLNSLCLHHLPDRLITDDICIEAIKQNIKALSAIDNVSVAVCIEAVKITPSSFAYIRNQTDELCIAAISVSKEVRYYIRDSSQRTRLIPFLVFSQGEKCCVCFEQCNSVTQCNHPLCSSCFVRLIFKSCPLCRTRL